ncbi:MAG: hypothetical protein HF967_03440 [Methanosarcinales archaeon]|nr:hypothetical protein [Methanosarcinales archaeon]
MTNIKDIELTKNIEPTFDKDKHKFIYLEELVYDYQYSDCDNLIQNFKDYYDKKQYKLIKDVYNSLLY